MEIGAVANAKNAPDRTAVVFGDTRYTWARVERRASISSRTRSARSASTAATRSRSCSTTATSSSRSGRPRAKTGLVTVPLNYRLRGREIQYIVDNSDARARDLRRGVRARDRADHGRACAASSPAATSSSATPPRPRASPTTRQLHREPARDRARPTSRRPASTRWSTPRARPAARRACTVPAASIAQILLGDRAGLRPADSGTRSTSCRRRSTTARRRSARR